jgi:hypothetical protein
MWSNIRHPNMLRKFTQRATFFFTTNPWRVEFLGANILDDKPFILMPYLKNGNARDYLNEHPDGDRLNIVCMPNVTIQVSVQFNPDRTSTATWHFSGACLPPLK